MVDANAKYWSLSAQNRKRKSDNVVGSLGYFINLTATYSSIGTPWLIWSPKSVSEVETGELVSI